jgi:hypothetical protein
MCAVGWPMRGENPSFKECSGQRRSRFGCCCSMPFGTLISGSLFREGSCQYKSVNLLPTPGVGFKIAIT